MAEEYNGTEVRLERLSSHGSLSIKVYDTYVDLEGGKNRSRRRMELIITPADDNHGHVRFVVTE